MNNPKKYQVPRHIRTFLINAFTDYDLIYFI